MVTDPFEVDDFLPGFYANTLYERNFNFAQSGGHRTLLAFVGDPKHAHGEEACRAIVEAQPILAQANVASFAVVSSAITQNSEEIRHIDQNTTIFLDRRFEVFRKYRMATRATPEPGAPIVLRTGAFLIRENLRLQAFIPFSPIETFCERLSHACDFLLPVESFLPAAFHAPVLQIPRVFNLDLCRDLIGAFDRDGGVATGFMRDVDGKTKGLFDPIIKNRRDCHIKDQDLLNRARNAIRLRLLPEIQKSFAFQATRVERYLVARYGSEGQDFFRAHRDNVSKGTAHRRFAVTVNLNTEEFDGGELWFPEYGRRLYKPETGAAVVFSCSLLHEALPVSSGTRYAFLPFLYDEAGARVRAANHGSLDNVNSGPTIDGDTSERSSGP